MSLVRVKLLWAFLGLLLIVPLVAESVSGIIHEDENGLTIQNVYVFIGSFIAITNNTGIFNIENIPPGNYTLTTSHVGFDEYSQHITVVEGSNVNLNITLEPKITRVAPVVATTEAHKNKLIIPKDENQKEITDYIKQLPGVNVIEGSNTTGVSIRGCKTTDVLVVVDGVELPRNEQGKCDLNSISTSNIKSIEVLSEGIPASYSAKASGGLVLIETYPPDKRAAQLILKAGSYESYGIEQRFEKKIMSNLSFSESVKYSTIKNNFRYTTVRDTNIARINNHADRLHANISFLKNGGINNTRLNLSAQYLDEGMPGDVLHPTPKAYRKGYSLNSSLNNKSLLSKKYYLSLDGMVNYSFKEYYSPRPYVYINTDAEYITSTYKLSSKLSRTISLFTPELGLEYLLEDYQTNDHVNEGNSISNKDRYSFSYWFEIPVHYNPTDNIKLHSVASIRQDIVDSKHVFNKSIENSIIFAPDFYRVGLSFGYAEAFRLPTFLDLYWMRSAFSEGNPDLAPEKSVKKHIKISSGLDIDFINIDASVDFFSRDIDSVIVWVKHFNGVYKPINSNREETTGREDYLRITLFDDLHFSWINTTIEALHVDPGEYLDDKWIPFQPKYLQQASVKYCYGGLSCEILNRMVGKKYILAANTKWTNSYSILEANLKYTHNIGDFTLITNLSIENINDVEYEVLVDYPMPGRSYSLSMSLIYER